VGAHERTYGVLPPRPCRNELSLQGLRIERVDPPEEYKVLR
jgi:hypothetical protein